MWTGCPRGPPGRESWGDALASNALAVHLEELLRDADELNAAHAQFLSLAGPSARPGGVDAFRRRDVSFRVGSLH